MNLKSIVLYLLYATVGGLLIYLFLQNAPLTEIKNEIAKANLKWYGVVIMVSTAVYVVRTLRWQMMLRSINCLPHFVETFAAISASYFVSIGVPRFGEITRCIAIARRRKVPFVAVLGTVITERIIDVLALFVVLIFTFMVQNAEMRIFYLNNIITPIKQSLGVKFDTGNLKILIILLAVIAVGWLLMFLLQRGFKRLPQRIQNIFIEAKNGLTSINKLKHAWLFYLYTLLIWVGYFFMTWFWFFAFDETRNLGWGVCLSIISIGTIGRSVPIQGGGMGAYHYLVEKVTAVYNISATMGKTLAIVIHGGQIIFTLCIGILGWLYLVFSNPQKIK